VTLVHEVVAHCTLLSAVSRKLGDRSVAAKFSPDIVTGTAAEITALYAQADVVIDVVVITGASKEKYASWLPLWLDWLVPAPRTCTLPASFFVA